MAYLTGTAANITALMDNLRSACTSNGWTLSGNILHKGNCYIRSQINNGFIEWMGGTGKDVSNNLTGAAPRVVRTGDFRTNALTFPCNYEAFIFSNPDEVVFVINYSTDFYQYVMFGLSDVANLPGVGVYYAASRYAITGGSTALWEFASNPNGLSSTTDASQGAPAFTGIGSGQLAQSSYIHHGFDGATWTSDSNTGTGYATSFHANAPLLSLLPSSWNGETVLLPFPIYVNRSTGNKVSLAADLKNIRHCRIDNHSPGATITLGADKWKLYPWYKKNTTVRDGSTSEAQHSGTLGYAVRYDGP